MEITIKSIATNAHSTWTSGQKRLQQWALCGAVALVATLGAGQALAASSPPFVDHGDGTVTDTSTGLMWDQRAAGLSGNGSYGAGVFQSSEAGQNWNLACASQPANLNLLSLAVTAAGKLYAGSEVGVFVSSDSCASWSAINTGMP